MQRNLREERIAPICLAFILAIVALGFTTIMGRAADSQSQGISLSALEGSVSLEDASGTMRQIEQGDLIDSSATLVTGEGANATVSLHQGRTLYVDANTRVTFVQEKKSLELVVAEG